MDLMDTQELAYIPKIHFGNTGLLVSRLAFGTGTNGVGGRSDQSALGLVQLADLLVQAYDHGINFWDAADDYGTHPHLRYALKSVPRDGVVILTKTMARNAERVIQDVDRFLREMGTDTIDVVLLHAMTRGDWVDYYRSAMLALSKAKADGKVRAVGVSCHSLVALKTASETAWTEVVMARINHAGTNMDGSPGVVTPLLQKMHADGKAVIGMKVLGCGRLSEDLHGAFNYVFGLGSVHAITVGIRSQDELLDDIRIIRNIRMEDAGR